MGQGGSRLTTTPEAAVRAQQEERTGPQPATSAAPAGPDAAAPAQPEPSSAAQTAPAQPSASSPPEPASSGPQPPTEPAAPPQPAPVPGLATRSSAAPATSSRVRARLARLGGPRPGGPSPVLEPLFRIVRASDPKADLRTLERAYQIAEKYHRGQLRKSGDPYITHPLAVTTILAELGMDTADPVRGPAARHGRGHRRTRSTCCAATSATRSRCSSTASPSSTRSSTATPRRPRPCARWSSRWPRTSGSWSSSSPTGCTTCAPCATCAREKQEQKARETLEIYAPLAHRLGMNTIKWELEDLSFATLYPKMYDEIVRLVAERAPKRDEYLARGHRPGQRRPARRQDQGHGHRPAEALLLDLPEDDRPRPRLHRDLRPGRHPRPGRLGPRLLRGARRHARALEPGPGPVQGLHRDAEVQHVPVAAHDGDRPAGQAGRDADPHALDAPPRRVRRRRALEVQGGGRTRPRRRRPRSGGGRAVNDMAWLRQLLDWQNETEDPGEFLDVAALRPVGAPRSSSSRPRATSSRCRPARRRSTSPTPCTPRSATDASAPGSTAGSCRSSRTLDNGDVVEVFTSKAPTAGPSRDWLGFVKSPRARNKIRAVVHQGAPRGGHRAGQGRDRQAPCASRACRSSG